jgi:hypothetical protein
MFDNKSCRPISFQMIRWDENKVSLLLSNLTTCDNNKSSQPLSLRKVKWDDHITMISSEMIIVDFYGIIWDDNDWLVSVASVAIPCYTTLSSHPLISTFVIIISCYPPILSSHVIIPCCHLMVSSLVIISCYHPMLSAELITAWIFIISETVVYNRIFTQHCVILS